MNRCMVVCPSADVDWGWAGDPDRGFGDSQPGGWIYNMLPYVEQIPLFQQGAGRWLPARRPTFEDLPDPARGLHCPSRRSAIAYPNAETPLNIMPIDTAAAPTTPPTVAWRRP